MKRICNKKLAIKIVSLALIFPLLLLNVNTALLVNAAEPSVAAKGTCGKDALWTLTDDGVLTISGSGEMKFLKSPWWRQAAKITTVIIEDGITKIEKSAFSDHTALKKVVIHGAVELIDDSAFAFCNNIEEVYYDSVDCLFGISFGSVNGTSPLTWGADLYIGNKPATEVVIPSYVKNLGKQLLGAVNLKKVTIPSGVISIDYGAFHNCKALESINIPDTVTSIRGSAFYNCQSLKKITIPDSVQEIGMDAFKGCNSLEEVRLPKTLSLIESGMFEDCYKLKSITLPKGITEIGYTAFANCKAITSVSIPATVEEIRPQAFRGCTSLKSITLHPSVKSIGDYAFADCPAFTDINFYGTLSQWHEIRIIVNAYDNQQTKVRFVSCAHKNTTVAPMEKPTSFYPGYTEGVFCNDCNKFISGREEIPPTNSPFTDSDSAKIIDGTVFALPEITCSALISHSDPGSYILADSENGLGFDELPGTGMTLAGLNGLRNTIIIVGDADGDGKATASDARLALRLAVGLESYEADSLTYKALNVNGGVIDSSDARDILRASVSLEKLKLPAGN